MSKRKSSFQVATAKKLKSLPVVSQPTVSRSTRSSRSKAEQLIKTQVDVGSSSDDDDDDDNFILPSQASTSTGIVVECANSFLSDSSSGEEDAPTKKKPLVTQEEDSSSESSSSYFEQPRVSTGKVDSFDAIEKNILTGVSRLTDSEDSEMEDVKPSETFVPTHVLFPSLAAANNVEHTKTKSKTQHNKSKSSKSNTSKKQDNSVNKVSMLDVTELLAMGESQATPKKTSSQAPTPKKQEQKSRKSIKQESDKSKHSSKSSKTTKVPPKKKSGREVLSESEKDWEEVEHIDLKDVKHAVIPKEGVEITVQLPDIVRRKKKKQFDVEACIKRRINQIKRENQIVIHQVSLLCWLGHGMYVNSILNSPSVMGFALSLIPSQHSYPKQVDLRYLEQITKWFKKYVVVLNEEEPNNKTLQEILEECFQSKKAYNKRILVLLFICMLRSLGIKSRLILSLQPLPLKPRSEGLCSFTTKKEGEACSSKADKSSAKKPSVSKSPAVADKKMTTSNKQTKSAAGDKKMTASNKQTKSEPVATKKGGATKSEKTSKYFPSKTSTTSTPDKKREPKSISEKVSTKKSELSDKNKNTSKSPSSVSHSSKNKKTESHSKSPDKVHTGGTKTNDSQSSRSLRGRKPSKYKDASSDSEDDKKPSKPQPKSSKVNSKIKTPTVKSESAESDFEPEVISIRKSQAKVVDRKVLSSEEELPASSKPKTKGVDIWVEVFVEMEEKWICVDVPNAKVHCVSELYVSIIIIIM